MLSLDAPNRFEAHPTHRWVRETLGGKATLCALVPASQVVSPRALEERLARLSSPAVEPLAAHPREAGTDVLLPWDELADDALAAELAEGPLAIADVMGLVDQLLLGLAAAHSAGLVHPGLTPSLVRLRSGPGGSLHASMVGFGVPPAPERGARDDVRDLGAIAYRMISGSPPDWSRGDPAPPSTLRADAAVPPKLEHVVMRALGIGQVPYESADAMRAALQGVIGVRNTGSRVRTTTNPQVPRAMRSELVAADDLVLELPQAPPAPAPRRSSRLRWIAPLAALIAVAIIAWRSARDAPPDAAPTLAPLPATSPEPSPAPEARASRASSTATRPPPPTAAPSPPAAETPSVQPSPPSVVPPLAPALPTSVTARVVTTPSGATVSRSGVILGKTPLDVRVERGDLPVTLVIERDGYTPESRTLERSDATTLELEIALERRPAPRPRPRPTTPQRPPPEIVNER